MLGLDKEWTKMSIMAPIPKTQSYVKKWYWCTGSSYIYTVLIAQGPAQIKNIKTKSI